MAVQSGLIDKVPPLYAPDESQNAQRTEAYARHLLTELQDPDASARTLKKIIVDARQFKSWVEARRKDGVRRALQDSRPEDRIIEMPPGRPRSTAPSERRPRRFERINPPDPSPSLHPMWDDWIDSLER
jgi:hypothetical protein